MDLSQCDVETTSTASSQDDDFVSLHFRIAFAASLLHSEGDPYNDV